MNFWRVVLRHEVLIFLTLVILALTVGTINPVFFSIFNIFSLLKNSTVIGFFAIGFFLVLVTGGLDVSFAAVGVTAMYCTVKLAVAYFFGASFLLLCAVSALIGVLLGLINGLLVIQLRAPSLIVTLGTLSLFRGFLLFFVGNDVVRQVPPSINDFAHTNVMNVTTANGAHIGLHASVVIFAAVTTAVFLFLRYTTLGRCLYAVGGNPVAARRMGINVAAVEVFAYCAAGALAGIAGLLSAAILRLANPQTLVGSELDVIAAAVLGGAAITGGSGSVIGVFLGTLLIVLTNNSLIILGIPSYWQKVAVGAMLVAAIGFPLLARRQSTTRRGSLSDDPAVALDPSS